MQNYISSTKRVGWDNVEEINKNWTTLLDKNKRRMGQTYSIYIGNLPQNERSEDPLQYKKDWKKKYDEFVKQHLAENQWSDPLSVQQALNAFSIHIKFHDIDRMMNIPPMSVVMAKKVGILIFMEKTFAIIFNGIVISSLLSQYLIILSIPKLLSVMDGTFPV